MERKVRLAKVKPNQNLYWKQSQSFPVGWCGKRILNGDEDNVWHKYQVLTSDEYQSGAMTQPSTGPAAE